MSICKRTDILCKLHVETDKCTYVIFDNLDYYVIPDDWEIEFYKEQGIDRTPLNPDGPYYKFKIEGEGMHLYFFPTSFDNCWYICEGKEATIREIINGINCALVEKFLLGTEENKKD